MLKVNIVENKDQWEQFLLSQSHQPFFQSWSWGEVQERLGNKIFRLGIFEGNKLVGICLTVRIWAKRGRYFHLRHGPLLSNFETQFESMLAGVTQAARNEKVDFIRMSPLLEEGSVSGAFFRRLGFRKAAVHAMDAEHTWVLDLDKSEDEILSGMRKTTRYLVRKAMSLPIEITVGTSTKDFSSFMKLYEMTSKRHQFVPHRGVEVEFNVFAKDGMIKLYLARFKRKVIAGAIVVFYGNQAVYHHGASSSEHKDIPAAYLLQWEAIKEAKRLGLKLYNFWGVVPPNRPKHPWQGLTLFKTGFGGRNLNFLHAQDLLLNTLGYWKTHAIETVWRIYRGY